MLPLLKELGRDKVSLVQLNWDNEYIADIMTDQGFDIDSTESYTKKHDAKNKRDVTIKNDNGLFSSKFGTDWADENAFQDRYSCKCKKYTGKIFENTVCEVCHTEVSFKDVDYKMFAYISLGDSSIIVPIYYMLLQSLIGKEKLKDILDFKIEFDLNGNEKQREVTKDNPYAGIGMTAFKEQYEDILFFFYKKKKKKYDLYKKLIADKNSVFASHIPVYNSILRPEAIRNETHYYNTENGCYKSMIRLSNVCRQSNKNFQQVLDVEKALCNIQSKLVKLYDLVFQKLNKKEGWIQQEILGARLSYAARNVIIPDASLDCNEVKMSYLCFLELYKMEIIGHITRIYDVTESVAFDVWNNATLHFDENVYEIIQMMVDRENPTILLNRNPTINYGSILCMKIKEVGKDYDDLTLSLPIAILKVLNADFDGDTLNIIALKTIELKEEYSKSFDPKTNFFIDKLTGEFNTDFDLLKDQQIGLWAFAHM